MTASDPAAPSLATDAAAPRGDKDRFLTTMRAAAVFSLTFVHWGWAVVVDNLSGTGMDTLYGWHFMAWATWLFAWIPPVWLGMFGALSRDAARGRVRTFYRKRYTRLLVPYYVFAAVLVTIQLSLWSAGAGQCGGNGPSENAWFSMSPLKALTWIVPFPHFDCFGITMAPLWFLAAFLLLTAIFPLFVRIYDKPRWRLPFLALLALSPLFFDVVNRVTGHTSNPLPVVYIFQLLAVWGIFGYLGFFYRDRYQDRPEVRRWFPWVFLGLGLLTAVMAAGPYPDAYWSGMHGNQFPPTAAYVTAGLAATALLLWGRDVVVRFSELPGIARFVDWLALRNYTIYIWHQVPLVIVVWAVTWLGLVPTLDSWPIVVQRIFYFLAPWPLLLLVVKVFAPVEKWGFPPQWWQRRRELRRQQRAAAPPPSAEREPAAVEEAPASTPG